MGRSPEEEELYLHEVLESIQGKTIRERAEGVKNLKAIFERSQKSSNIGVLTDKAYHKIYEVIFKVAIAEKQTYLHGAKSSRNTALTRLSSCADTIWTVVRAGTSKLKRKTVQAVVDHITQTLQASDGTYLEPIAQPYLKTLSALFEHKPHVEQLQVDTWQYVVKFCLAGVNQYLEENDEGPAGLSKSFSGLASGSLAAKAHSSSKASSVSKQNVEELFQTLLLLVSAPNAPILTRYDLIADSTMRFLKLPNSSMSLVHQLAFSIVNAVLLFTRSDHTTFSASLSQNAIPIICRFWQEKSAVKDNMLNSVRDEMMILLIHTHPHLQKSIQEGIESSNLLMRLEELSDVLRADYAKRSGRDQLHLDDIEIIDIGAELADTHPFRLENFRLRPFIPRAERNWAHLQLVGVLERLLRMGQQWKMPSDHLEVYENERHPRKRQKIAQILDRILQPLAADDEVSKIASLHALPFVLHDCQLSKEELSSLLRQLHLCAQDKRENIAAWALLAISSCTYQPNATNLSALDWIQSWQIGARAITINATCRTASVQLHSILARNLVHFHDIAEEINAMITSTDTNGPVILSESSMNLMTHLLHARVIEVPGSSLAASQLVIRWLFAKWNPDNKSYAMQESIHVSPIAFMTLLTTCLGLPRSRVPWKTSLPGGPLAQAWQRHLNNRLVIQYLLLIDDNGSPEPSQCLSCPKYANLQSENSVSDSSHFQSTRKLVLELLFPKFKALMTSWRSHATDHSTQASFDIYTCTVSSCMIVLLCMKHFKNVKGQQIEELGAQVLDFSKDVFTLSGDLGSKGLKEQAMFETVLQTVHPFLPNCEISDISHLAQEGPHMLQLFKFVAEENVRRHIALTSILSTDADQMDIDKDYSTQNSQGTPDGPNPAFPRHDIGLEMNSAAFYLTISGRLILLVEIDKNQDVSGFVPSSFIDHLISLSNEELVASRRIVLDVLGSDLVTENVDANSLLEHLLTLLASYSFDRCEVAMAFCLDVLVSLGPQWFNNDSMEELREAASTIYTWVIQIAIGKDAASPEAQNRICRLLLLLVRSQPEYGGPLLPSPKASLFNLLTKSNLAVKFYIGIHLPEIFGYFLLETHDQLLVDILELFPTDRGWMEGISFRMFALAKLASKWSNLLRRCIYHIFEIPGTVPGAVKHATKCLEDVASALEVNGPREIFDLFSPQLLFTWTEYGDIHDIPFEVFGFTSLEALVLVAREELTGLMMSRGEDDKVDAIARILGMDRLTLLQKSFSKVMAYCIAMDSKSGKGGGTKSVTLESRIKSSLGQDVFFKLLNQHFVEIVAVIFHIMDQESDVEKYFGRSKDFLYASERLSRIKGMSSSKTELPPNQQPLYSSKSFPYQLLLLCSRTAHSHNNLYTPALVTYIARKVLNTLHPALGSLHNCAVLRKLRVLVSLAGDSALQGYPLEMLLQATRPFLVNVECAEDAIGLTKYLLMGGVIHLSKNPFFVAGLGLSYLGSLRIFLQSNQSSTTQESQFKTTMSAAQMFREWFGKYLSSYESPGLRSHLKTSFQTLLRAAYEAEPVGNADAGSSESRLLLQLLKDQQDGGSLLNHSSRKLALGMLCSKFRPPISFQKDFLGADEQSIANAAVVWKSCMDQSVSDEYLSWAARVLGRAFTASGHVPDELLQESDLRSSEEFSGLPGEVGDSRSTILKILQDLTLETHQATVGLSESALRFALSSSEQDVIGAYQVNLTSHLYTASIWDPYHIPPSEIQSEHVGNVTPDDILCGEAIAQESWLQNLSIGLAQSVPNDHLLLALVPILRGVDGFAGRIFPFLLHLSLSALTVDTHFSKRSLSKAFVDWLSRSEDVSRRNLKILINAILYLRTQPISKEKSSAVRTRWLDIDYLAAAKAATICGMHKTALLLIEEFASESVKSSRRSLTSSEPKIPNEILLTIFENIDDPDLYYGVQQPAGLDSIIARFEYEKDGPKSLAFRGAQYDSHIRRGAGASSQNLFSLVKALDTLNLSGLSHSLLQSQQTVGTTSTSLDSMFRSARKLEQWDIPVPPAHNSNAVTVYKAFQTVHTSLDRSQITLALNEGLERTMRDLVRGSLSASALHESLQTLASLTEMDEILSSQSSEDFEELLTRFQQRSEWMTTGRFDDITPILSCRGTTLSTVSRQQRLQNIMSVPLLDARVVEVKAALLSSKLNRAHNALEESVSLATSMMDLIQPCSEVGLKVGVSIHIEAANTLWDQGEMSSSIGMLQGLNNGSALKEQTITVARSDLLWKIGYQVSVARLEKPDRIIDKYLKPALKELNGKSKGSEAGEVFHQFAVFCDQQLQDPDSLGDLERLQRLRKNKGEEVEQYKKFLKSATSGQEKNRYRSDLKKAETLLRQDEEELQRQNASRDEFLRQSLENFLLALSASDDHDGNTLRFSALWLEHSEDQLANDAVSRHLAKVPSRKFASLMNQLTSRLQDNPSSFQRLLYALVRRICQEHPYHGMYQIYSSSKTKPNSKDETAASRHRTTLALATEFKSLGAVAQIWHAISMTNNGYCLLAAETDERYKQSKKFPLSYSRAAEQLHNLLQKYPVPPPTMNIPLAANLDYSNVSKMRKFDGQLAIAGGVSMPKILTAIADNGKRFKQLVKGGNDDLRQDAIMEQVFEQVSELLKTNRSTRQRNLSIRTYKVLPLSSKAGVIEFVSDTIPLHEYLMPAHERYHPKDLTGPECRAQITEVHNKPVEVKVARYRTVIERFHPALRYFFIEKFSDPDDWFAKRLAYTRSTAAISILGYVLGLGDRHGHNILLDNKSGEVVHIDLGIAFEMGRVLPIPELVPFRMTRDIVDGMGITKTEGVFRRCCEFTLEALRKEIYSIMTILDVLRYDPLYSWSISPVRLAKLQEEQSAAPKIGIGQPNERQTANVNEPGEAARALTVVNKKLSKTLSVTATVNDLINQASDERNLASLFSGWAAYA